MVRVVEIIPLKGEGPIFLYSQYCEFITDPQNCLAGDT